MYSGEVPGDLPNKGTVVSIPAHYHDPICTLMFSTVKLTCLPKMYTSYLKIPFLLGCTCIHAHTIKLILYIFANDAMNIQHNYFANDVHLHEISIIL